MDYKIEKSEDLTMYYNQERSASWEGTAGDYLVTIWSHPKGRYSWEKSYRSNQPDKAQDACRIWVEEGQEPLGVMPVK